MAEGGANRSAIVAGIVFIASGAAFLLEGLDVWELRPRMLAPAALIGIGLVVLLGGRGGRPR